MSHYFSRVQLTARPRDNELLIQLSQHGEAYRDHALIWQLFPGDGVPRDFLFRSERGAAGAAVYYVISQRPPQSVPGLFAVQSKPYTPQLTEGEWLQFDLRANPTVSRGASGKKSQRHDVLMDAKHQARSDADAGAEIEAAALQWLLKRAPDWGLNVREDSLLTSGYVQHRLRHKGQRIEFSSLDYQGVAQVRDPQLLAAALMNGVGRARGFGCGLLLVKRMG